MAEAEKNPRLRASVTAQAAENAAALPGVGSTRTLDRRAPPRSDTAPDAAAVSQAEADARHAGGARVIESPELRAGFLGQAFFCWVNALFAHGNARRTFSERSRTLNAPLHVTAMARDLSLSRSVLGSSTGQAQGRRRARRARPVGAAGG